MNKELIKDYIKSLVKLYGVVSKDKVIEIFNMQNDDKIKAIDIEEFLKDVDFSDEFFICKQDYFAMGNFKQKDIDELIKIQGDSQFYVPRKEVLLQYKDNQQIEDEEECKKIFDIILEHIK